MSTTTDRTEINRRGFFKSGAAIGASLLSFLPALAQAEPVLPPYRYEEFTHDVVDLCARYYGTTKQAVLSPLREMREVKARQVAMYIAYHLSKRSLPDIGRRTGGRMPTTVLYAVRKIEVLIDVDLLRRHDIAVLTDAAHRIACIRIGQAQPQRAAS